MKSIYLFPKTHVRTFIFVSASILAGNALAQSAPAPAKPRTALIYFGGSVDSPANLALAARYQIMVLSLWPGMGEPLLQANVRGIKSINPRIKLAQYLNVNETRDSAGPSDPFYLTWQSINANDWWLRDAAGNRTQWGTPEQMAHNVNSTAWTKPDANGQRWPQVKAKFDTDSLLTKMNGIDYVFIDGVSDPLADADYKRIGTNQSHKDPVIVSAVHNGIVDYLSALRSLNPTLKILGSSADLSSPEYKGQVEGTLRECLMGKSWSIETYAGWVPMMNSYRAALANTKAPHDVLFGACSLTSNPALPAVYRYGLASVLLEDGYFAFSADDYRTFPWFDESDAPLGTAAELPPTAATPSGIWMRRYTNGVALVNPSTSTTLSIDLGTGYKHLNGAIDPVVNNGLAERVVTLPPRSGLIMVKATAPNK